MINIIQKGTVSTSRAVAHSLQYSGAFMEIPQLTVVVKSPTKIAFEIGDFITWSYDGLTYTLKELPKVNKQARANTYGEAFVYENVQFVSALADVKYIEFLDVVPTASTSYFSSLPTFSFYGNVFALIDRLNANLGRLYSNWIVQAADVESGDIFDALYTDRQVDISSPTKIWEALGLAYSMWGLGWVYYYDTGTSKHTIVIGATGGNTANFAYGQGSGLYMVGKSITKEDSIVTRLRAYGSTRNMPARYYNNKSILIDRQLLPDPFLFLPNLMIPYDKWQYTGGYPDPNLAYINCNSADVDAADTSYAAYGIREKSIFFDGNNNLKDIYPTIEQITALEMRTAIAGYSGAQYGLYYSPDVTEYPDATRLDKIKVGDTLTDDGVIKSDTVYTETVTYAGSSGNEVMTTEVMTKIFDPIYTQTLTNEGEYKVTFTPQYLTVTGVNTDITDGTLRVWIKKNGSRVSLSKTIPATIITGGVEFAAPELTFTAQEGGDIYSIELDMDITIPALSEGEIKTIHWELDLGTATYTLTKVVPITNFTISLKQIGFDIFKFLPSAGQTPVISMTSGSCAARQFQIKRADYIAADDSWQLVCTRQSDTSLNQWFPNKTFKIKAEDTFVLLNINMPDILIDVAEDRLYREACKWLLKAKEQQYIFEPKIDDVYMALNPQVIKEGMMMPLTDTDLRGVDAPNILINSLTVTENEDAVRKFDVVLRDDTDTDLIKYLNAQAKQVASNAVSTITNATTSTNESAATAVPSTPTTELGYTPENVANKTSVLSANSTLAQYPNAKTVYDFVQLAGDSYIPKTQNVLLKEPTGFKDGAIVTYSATNRTITLTGTVEAYFNGLLVPALVSGWVSPAHPATLDHIYFLHYDGTNFVWADNTFPGFYFLTIAIAYYRTSNPFATRECHGFQQWQSHLADHYNIGTYRTGGGDITNLILNSTTADNRRPIVSECAIQDEDLLTYNPALTTKKYSQRFISGASTINYALQANDIVPLSTNNPYYNSFTSPNFGQTLMPANSAMTVWLFEVPVTSDAGSQEIRHAFVQGQSITLAANASPAALATAVSTEKLKSPLELNLGVSTVVASEYVCIHKFIITYSGGNWAITDSIKITGSRASQVGSPSGNYLTAVSTDDTITGNGSVGLPLSIATYAAKKAGDIALPFSASKLTSVTLVVPSLAPTDLTAGQTALYATESGFTGETPSGAGSMTNITLSLPTGLEVSLDNTSFAQSKQITGEGGTFYTRVTSDYVLPTALQLSNKVESSLIGAANGIAPLDSGGKVALGYLPSTLLKYVGVWNASTNTPTLTNPDTNRKGQVWNVSVAGTQFGLDFKLGDWLIYNDSGVPEKSDNSDDVTSVNGYTGAVTLKTSDIAEQTNLYYTDARVKSYADTLYTPIAHASATNNPHSVTAAQVGALGVNAKAADSELLDGLNSTNFFRTDRYIPISNVNFYTYNFEVGSAFYAGGNGTGNSNAPFAYGQIIELGNRGAAYGHSTMLGVSHDNKLYFNNCYMYDGNGGGYSGWREIYHAANSNSTSINWSAAKLTSTTLILPQTTPSLATGEMAIYGLESGFSGETPSGAGTMTSIALTLPTGLRVKKDEGGTFAQTATITESGTFIVEITSGYALMTSLQIAGLHNAVTLGTNQNGLSLSTQVLSLGLASTNTSGALSSTDWNTFNGKEPAITKATAFNKNFGTTTGTVLEGRTFGTAAAAATTDFLAANGKAADSDLLDGHDTAYFQTALTNPVTGTGTSGYVAQWTGKGTVGNSGIYRNGNNYGIGTTTAGGPLEIKGTTDSLGSRTSVVGINGTYASGASGYPGISFLSNGTLQGLIRSPGDDGLAFYYGSTGTEAMRIHSTGVLLVGTTTNNGAKVQVAGSISMTENINTNLRIPKVAPTSPVTGEYYFYVVE